MQLLLLGTAAAECWPAPHCSCDACNKARRLGGPNIRTRPGAMIDDDLKIDFGPDTLMQLLRHGRDLLSMRTLIFTHQHSDHFVPTELEWAMRPFTLTPPAPGSIELWGNSHILDGVRKTFPKLDDNSPYALRHFEAGDQFTTASGDEVWALPADHVTGAAMLRIRRRRDGKTILYGHDSGLYPDAALKTLSDGTPLDVALLDCTFGGETRHGERSHMSVDGVVTMVQTLRAASAITDRTRVIATHFSHGGKWMHHELVAHFMPYAIEVAYDGMIVEV